MPPPANGHLRRQTMATAHPAHRPMTAEEKKVIFASSLGTVFEWYDFYLYGSLAAIIAKQFFSGLDAAPPSSSRCWRSRRLPRASLRRDLLRPPGRHDRPQVHLPGDHPDHGPVDLHRRHPAELRQHRRGRAGDPDRAAPAAGPGARRRVRRRRHLRRRALAARQARRVHGLDPDHGDAGPVPVADGDPGHPHADRRGRLRRLGLAYSVPRCPSCCWPSRSGSGCR